MRLRQAQLRYWRHHIITAAAAAPSSALLLPLLCLLLTLLATLFDIKPKLVQILLRHQAPVQQVVVAGDGLRLGRAAAGPQPSLSIFFWGGGGGGPPTHYCSPTQ